MQLIKSKSFSIAPGLVFFAASLCPFLTLHVWDGLRWCRAGLWFAWLNFLNSIYFLVTQCSFFGLDSDILAHMKFISSWNDWGQPNDELGKDESGFILPFFSVALYSAAFTSCGPNASPADHWISTDRGFQLTSFYIILSSWALIFKETQWAERIDLFTSNIKRPLDFLSSWML